MKTIEFKDIGTYEIGQTISIKIFETFKKGLINLELFSHCLIFTRDDSSILCYIAKILDLDSKSGNMVVDNTFKEKFRGDLLDIKAYFPCEEIVEGIHRKEFSKSFKFTGESIGKFMYINGKPAIKLNEICNEKKLEAEDFFENLKEGDYIRVIWWFHKFDKEKYRKYVTANPPYKNAPRSGVFATRSPVRPNLIASTISRVKSIDKYNSMINICGFDGFEGSVILQLMPYQYSDQIENVKVPYWVEEWTGHKVFNSDEPLENEKIECNLLSTGSYEKDIFVEELEKSIETSIYNREEIIIEKANVNNLKSVSVNIPKNKITSIVGISGSGKSSLAFDTIYKESQRQFVDLVSSNSYLDSFSEPSRTERISGLQPAIAIEQKNLGQNPRSTVGSVTGASNFLRLLFSTIGERVCPDCGYLVGENNICSNCERIFFELTPSYFNNNNPDYMCPVCRGLGEELKVAPELIVTNPEISILDGASPWWGNLRKHQKNPNANWMRGEVLALAENMDENLEVPFEKLSEDFRNQIFYGSGKKEVSLKYKNTNGRSGLITRPVEGAVNIIGRLLKENSSNKSISHIERFIVSKKCSVCKGERLGKEGRNVKILGMRYPDIAFMEVNNLRSWCHYIYNNLNNGEREKTKEVFINLIKILRKIEDVGIGYLTLNRAITTLSGGEGQRLKLATQFSTGLSDILYIMDEPSKGLHPRDYKFLMRAIESLREKNNTVIMVEHKEPFVEMSDYVIEIGPGAGRYGGKILKTEENFDKKISPFDEKVNYKLKEDLDYKNFISITGARANNLKNIDVKIPVSKFTCVIGVSGSGKSSLVSETIYSAVSKKLCKQEYSFSDYDKITGIDNIKEIHYVSQDPIGRNSRSNPATYTGVLELIRNLYSKLDDSIAKNLKKDSFSFNSKAGQCVECKGMGEIIIPMHFMEDIAVVCRGCKGKRYNSSILSIKYKGYTIADVLDMEVNEAKELFLDEEKIYLILDMLDKVGLSYVKLGQSSATLSGGEAQRIKLAKELCKTDKNALYILDEPTTGLHRKDIEKLIYIFEELVDKGSTLIVIEHNKQLIDKADYIIEMGPSGGEAGGQVVKSGWKVE